MLRRGVSALLRVLGRGIGCDFSACSLARMDLEYAVDGSPAFISRRTGEGAEVVMLGEACGAARDSGCPSSTSQQAG